MWINFRFVDCHFLSWSMEFRAGLFTYLIVKVIKFNIIKLNPLKCDTVFISVGRLDT